jgi:hypothetical protein
MVEVYLDLKPSEEEGLQDGRTAEVATVGGGGRVSQVPCRFVRGERGHDSRVARSTGVKDRPASTRPNPQFH